MKNDNTIETIILGRWPQLKKKAQNEGDADKLIAIIEDIDELLSDLELKIEAQAIYGSTSNADNSNPDMSRLVSD